jgi:nitrite reductase/ring-hydroxylating ferredoxin subunit
MTGRPREARIPRSAAPSPGEIRLLQLGRHRVGMFSDGEHYHALADRCPHRGAPLCSRGEVVTPIELRNGMVDLGRALSMVRCPWHKWDFEIATGLCAVDPKLRVRRYAVRHEGDELVVCLDHPADEPA